MKKLLLHVVPVLLLLGAFSILNAQTTNVIQGTIKDSKRGEPIVGASVQVKGTDMGTVTDTGGNYSLAVPAADNILVVSYIGFKSKEIDISKGNFNVSLDQTAMGLDEIVVTAQAIKREKRSLGYQTTTVNSEELNTATPTSALDALQGKVAGAQITNATGAPGGSTRVVLRGGTSLTGDNNALIVVDGVPIDNSNFGFDDILNNQYDAGNRANDINPQDVESVTVLNGSAAVTLYGERGVNGAVVYTTKTGKDVVAAGKKIKVSVNTNTSFQTPLMMPKTQSEFGQGLYGSVFDLRENSSWGPKLDGQVRPWGQEVDGEQRVKPYSAIPNDQRSFFQTGATYNNNVSISGGDKGTSFYSSFNNVDYKGIVPNTGYQRNSLRLNVSHDFGDKFTASASFNYTKTLEDLAVQGQSNQSLYFQVMNIPVDIPIAEIRDLNNKFNTNENYFGNYYLNPYFVMASEKTTDNVDRFLTNINLNWKPFKWLDLTGRFAADIYNDNREQKSASYDFLNRGSEFSYVGKYSQDLYVLNDYNGDLIARASNKFKNGIGLTGLLGFNIHHNKLRTFHGETQGLITNDYYSLENSVDRPLLTNSLYVYRQLGVYAEATISYKNWIFLDLTGRNDWSSTLPVDKRSYFYPGVNLSFVFSDLAKIDPKILSYGKIRAAFAQIGRAGSPYQLRNVFLTGDISDGYPTDLHSPYFTPSGGTVPGYSLSTTLANPDLKPELDNTWEVGTDLSFLNDRLAVTATYYNKLIKNEIITIPIAPSSGYTNEIVNAGIMSNKGVELSFRITPVSTKSGVKWDIYGTFNKNYGKVIQVSSTSDQISLGGLSSMAIVAQKGQPYGTFYAVTVQKDDKGRTIVDSASGIPLLTPTPQVVGNNQPKWLGSIGTSLSYKGFKFSVLFDVRVGGQFYSATASLQQFLGTDPKTTYNDRKDFVVPNSVYKDADGGIHPNTTTVTAMNYWSTFESESDYANYLISATNVKLRQVSLSYSIPAKIMKRTKFISGLEISVFGNNLWMWVPKSNTYGDPEVTAQGASNVQGFEFYNLPSVRSAGFGVKVDF